MRNESPEVQQPQQQPHQPHQPPLRHHYLPKSQAGFQGSPGFGPSFVPETASEELPFGPFAGKLGACGLSRDEYLGTLRNLLVRANEMMAPLIHGPIEQMSQVQFAAYTSAILNSPALHPSLFLPPVGVASEPFS